MQRREAGFSERELICCAVGEEEHAHLEGFSQNTPAANAQIPDLVNLGASSDSEDEFFA